MQNARAPDRVVHCASYGGPYAGSFVTMLAAAARAARDAGYETTICFSDIARDRPWLTELNGLAEIKFIKLSGVRGDLAQLKDILDEHDARRTILHTHFGAFDDTAVLLRLQRRRTAVLWHAHSGNPHPIRMRSKARGAIFGRIVNGIICVSPEIHAQARARHFPAAKLRQLPNAIDLGRFGPISRGERAAARNRLGLAPTDHVVLHFAWHWQLKGGDRLLAAADVMESEPELVFLTVVGEAAADAPRDVLERHSIVQALAPRANVKELYAAADAFLNTSRSEGMPYAVLEALARGLPVVATDLPVQRDVLDGLPGARVVRSDPQAIATALREVLAFTSDQRAKYAIAGRARVAASYALEPWSRRLVALYSEALGGTSQS